MPQVDFYVLKSTDTDDRHLFLCRLIEKLHRLQRRVFIHVPTESLAEQLDRLLWSFRADSFLPHGLLTDSTPAPIQIGFGDQLPHHRDVWVELDVSLTPVCLDFDRIIEIVIQESSILSATRRRFREYKQRGLELNSHNIGH